MPTRKASPVASVPATEIAFATWPPSPCAIGNLIYILDRALPLRIDALPSPWSAAEGTGQSRRRHPALSLG